MSLDAQREVLFGAIKNELPGLQPGLPIQFENQKFTQPRGAAWVSVSIAPGISRRKEISSSRGFYHFGVVNVTVLVPEDQGTKQMWDIASSVFSILADRDFSHESGKITTYGVQRRNRGLANGFYVLNVLCEYRHETHGVS